MKRILSFLLALAAVAAVAVNAAAAEVAVDQHRVLEGMGRSWYQGYQPTVRRGTMTICLPLEIDGGPEKITVAAALDDPNVFLLSETPKEVTAAQSDGIYPVKLQLSLKSNRRDGDYPITITVKNADGGELLGTIPYVIRIRNGYTTHETLEPVLSPVEGQLDAGCEGTLKLTVTNPTTTLSITHCVLTVTDADKEILMTGAGRVEIPEILPGQSQTVTIPVTVKADAAITEHVLEAELSYKVLDKEETWKQSLTVPVNQTIRMEQGGVQLPTAIAGELAARGAAVTLVSGRTALATPPGVERVDVLSADEMYDAAVRAFDEADGAVMCAAVADYTPAEVSETKIKKGDGELFIRLRRTRDIAAELGARKGGRLLVGFALETHDEEAHAESKLERKKFDFIVLNSLRDAGAGFRGDTNKVTFIDRAGHEELPLLSKREVAARIADRIERFFRES